MPPPGAPAAPTIRVVRLIALVARGPPSPRQRSRPTAHGDAQSDPPAAQWLARRETPAGWTQIHVRRNAVRAAASHFQAVVPRARLVRRWLPPPAKPFRPSGAAAAVKRSGNTPRPASPDGRGSPHVAACAE